MQWLSGAPGQPVRFEAVNVKFKLLAKLGLFIHIAVLTLTL